MPLTPELRQDIDDIRNYLFGGGYPDPVSNAEQLAFLFFFYLAEGLDAQTQARARLMKRPAASIYAGDWNLRNPTARPAPRPRSSSRRPGRMPRQADSICPRGGNLRCRFRMQPRSTWPSWSKRAART